MAQSDGDRTPRPGDLLILADGRRFQISSVEQGVRGWWFSAAGLDGSRLIQGNLQLDWDAASEGWRVAGSMHSNSRLEMPMPPSMRRAPTSKRKQFD
jgi:hypothetical protein